MRSASDTPCRSYGAGLVGCGCVGEYHSPGTLPASTLRSSIGHTGAPVTRSNTKRYAHFVTLRDGSDRLAVHGDVDERRRRRQVVIPDVVMHELVVPHAFTGSRIDTHEAACEEVVAGTMAAVVIAGRRFDGQIHVAELFVGRERRPDGRVAGVRPRVVQPGVVAELAGLRNRVEGPQPFSGSHVEAANVALGVFLRSRRRAADHRRADHDDISHDHCGRCGADDAVLLVAADRSPDRDR